MNKELKEKFAETFQQDWPTSEDMQKYCMKELSNGVELENGLLIRFEKPRIEKNFCFGAGQNGITTEEEWKNANEAASHARSSVDYFIEENMERNFKKYDLNQDEKFYAVFWSDKRSHTDCVWTESDKRDWEWKHAQQLRMFEMTETDKINFLEAVKEEKEKFLKRLNTYLKKYGLSKVNSWSYLVD